MAEIKILDASIYNKISAGEVVERPASVIKELTENSIDAGATKIRIEIVNGGIDEMTVVDNGCGIEHKFLKFAFLPHATSKIKSADDLSSIHTLGFRGEALASIASVSQVTMITKYVEEEMASLIELNGGLIDTIERSSASTGTTISVRNLFYNVPARKKFLKKPKQEEHEITSIVQKLILSNPDVSFHYIVDGKQVFYSTGNGLEDAIFAVYGISTLENLLPFDEKRNDMHLHGYIGKPSFTKPNRTYQTLIVNNRCVQNLNVSIAVNKGFETHLMKGQFPIFVMFLDVNPEKVDVNVHPTKLEVRFDDSGAIFSFVYNTVSNAILSNQDLYTIDMIDKPINSLKNNEPLEKVEQQDAFKTYDNIFTPTSNNDTNKFTNSNAFQAINSSPMTHNPNDHHDEVVAGDICFKKDKFNFDKAFPIPKSYETKPEPDYQPIANLSYKEQEALFKEKKNNKDFASTFKIEIYDDKTNELKSVEDYVYKDQIEKEGEVKFNSSADLAMFAQDTKNAFARYQEQKANLEEPSVSLLKNGYKVVGKLFNTFLFVECGESVILIDQHAAHERLIYDKLQSFYKNKDVAMQPLLLPYIIEVNAQEKSFFEQNIQQFYDIGFEIEPFGDKTFRVSAVPLLLGGNFDCKTYFDDVLSQVGKEIKVKESLRFDEYLMQRACKAAIKAGNNMSENEICCLVDAVLNNNTELFCPHGRPIAIKIDRKDVEKWFKRVL